MLLYNKRSLLAIVAGILIVAVVLGSFVYLSMQQNTQDGFEPLIIGLEPNQTNLLVYVAASQDYFRENGLNVTIRSYPSGVAAANALLKGEVNLASSTEFVFARNIMLNDSLQTIGSISKFTHVYIIANRSSGIQNVADLVGKKIGLTLQTNSEFYLGRFLNLNNIGLNQVNMINVPTSQYLPVLVNGTVDAVVAWQPYPTTIQNQLGSNNLILCDVQSGQPGYEPIISTFNWIHSQPDTVKKFLSSLIEAENYVSENPSKGQAISINSINFTSQYVRATWPNYLFEVSLDQSFLLAMQDEATWMISNSLVNVTSVPNFLNNIYLNGLDSVKASSITIIR